MTLDNGLLIKSWYNDLYDRELLDYGSFLENGFKDLKIDAREIIKVLKKNFSENILNY